MIEVAVMCGTWRSEGASWLQDHAAWFGWLFALGIGSLVLTVVLVPVVVVRLPADYFVASRKQARQHRTPLAWCARIGKNLLGAVFVLAGIAMLVLPGQGLLTILIGLLLVEFPGKRRLELAVVRRPAIRRFLDRLRQRHGRAPFLVPPVGSVDSVKSANGSSGR